MRIRIAFLALLGVLLVACTPQEVALPMGVAPEEALAPHVQTVCLTIEQHINQERSSQELDGAPSQPIAEGVERVLAENGTSVVAEGEPCEATLTIRVQCSPDGASYQHTEGSGSSYCFTGASCSVRGVLILLDQEEIEVYTIGEHDTPMKTSLCPQEVDAPFGKAWPKALLDSLSHLWGPEILDYVNPEDLAPTPERGEPVLIPTLIP